MNKGELTVRQQLILDSIRGFFAANMYPPTIRDIGRSVGIASTSVVSYNLDKLRDAGWINRDGRVSRGLQLVHKPLRRVPARGALVTVPLAGRIFAAVPVPMPAALQTWRASGCAVMRTAMVECLPVNQRGQR